jgi:hypothetical protein
VPSGKLAFNVLAAPARRGAKERCATPWPRAGLPMRELAGYSLGPKIGSIGTKAHNQRDGFKTFFKRLHGKPHRQNEMRCYRSAS